MSERRVGVHDSVFAKLVAIMVAMAVCILVAVFALFVVLTEGFHALINRNAVHVGLLVLFAFMIVAVVITAHLLLRQMLRPLATLNDGVARLGGGELDVRLPRTTRDEFGRLTDAFNQMVARVRDMIVARDQLMVDVSHELRSPLTRMKVTLELLPEGEQRRRLTSDVAEMERMVAELLELERLRARGIDVTRADLVRIVHDVVAAFQAAPGVRVVSSDKELPVDVDQERIRTVLRNLLDNAVKYSLPDSKPIEISAGREAGSVIVRVTDDGVGIPESDAARVFEPFYRVDRSRSKSTGGYGLGLSICERVMAAHGGSVRVERPAAGRGTTFVLTLPAPRTGFALRPNGGGFV